MPALPKTSFLLPAEAQEKLEALVLQIEANPGSMISPSEYVGLEDRLDIKAVLADLPEGLSVEDFAGILKLALLTECATESYSAVFEECAQTYNAAWIGRFTERVWTPDELTHYVPYKLILMNLGFSEAELDREVQETRDRQYVHGGGKDPVQLTTFGMIQECLTDSWHGLIGNVLAKSAPEAAFIVRRVKRRETLHAVWYRQMTAIQLGANPRLVSEVAGEICTFDMPSVSLVPEFQSEALRWQELMGGNWETIYRDLIRYVAEALGDVRLLGELGLLVATANKKLAMFPTGIAARILLPLGGLCHELMGEALLHRAQLGYLYKKDETGPPSMFGSVLDRLRSTTRSSMAGMIPPARDLMQNI